MEKSVFYLGSYHIIVEGWLMMVGKTLNTCFDLVLINDDA